MGKVEVTNYFVQAEMAAARQRRERLKVERYVQQYGGYLDGDMVVLPEPLSMPQINEMFDAFSAARADMTDVWKEG